MGAVLTRRSFLRQTATTTLALAVAPQVVPSSVLGMGGKTSPTLNGRAVGADAIALSHHDVLNLAGVELEFLLNPR